MAKHIRGSAAAGFSILCVASGASSAHAQQAAPVTLQDVVVSATPLPAAKTRTSVNTARTEVPVRSSPVRSRPARTGRVNNEPIRNEPVVNEPARTEPVVNEGSTGISVNKVPANISVINAKEFEQRNSPSVADTITARVAGAVALNIDGSDLSPDLFYRGFDASRVSGTAQGLAVFQNGVRINEVFGDNVNLDLIPPSPSRAAKSTPTTRSSASTPSAARSTSR